MLESDNTKKNFYIFLILFSVTLYVLGFIFNEDSAGGGKIDFNNTWNNQKIFDENSLSKSLENTKSSKILPFKNSHFPTSYILNKYLNPFSINKEAFRQSIFILNLFLPLFLFYALKNIFRKENIYLLAAYSSILYLSPYFRTSAYWSSLENYGLYCLIISIYFFSKYKNCIEYKEKIHLKNIYISLMSFFSCGCVYFDQKLLLIPLIYFAFLVKFEKNTNSKVLYFILNFIFAIPVISLVLYWGSIIPPHTTNTRGIGNFYFEQIGYSISIIFFYLIPYILIYYKKIIKEFNFNKIFILYLISLISILLILYFIDHDYGGWDDYGKGWLHKLALKIFENSTYQKIFTYILFFITIVISINILKREKIIIFFVFYMCGISILSNPIFQEYFDPLVFIMLSSFFYKNNELNNNFVITAYLFSLFFLIFTNIYYL